MAKHDSEVYQRLLLALLLITFSRDVAPILRRHCVACHGQGGVMDNGLDLRSWAGLMRGGNMGDDVVPGKPDGSAIVSFIEGGRGPEHRMPLNGKPLTREQIGVIRAWIQEGARR